MNCITVGCVRGDCAARCHSCASGRCARASHARAGLSCSCATGLHLPYAIEVKHRLARVRRLTPLRRRRRPIWLRLEGGPTYRPPTAASIFCPFQNTGRKRGFGLAFTIPSSQANRPLVLCRPRPGGALEKSGRVGPTWSCLWVSVETVRQPCTAGKQISSGKKWLGRGQVVSPRQIYEQGDVKLRIDFIDYHLRRYWEELYVVSDAQIKRWISIIGDIVIKFWVEIR